MRILVFSGYYLPGFKGGGPVRTIANLISQTREEIDYTLVTRDRDLGDTVPYPSIQPGRWNQNGNTPVFYLQPGLKGFFQALKILTARNYDIVYLNSFFSFLFSIFPLIIAKLISKTVVLGPRGEFSGGALALKSTKKRMFLFLYKLFRLQKGILFQASSPFEARDIRRVFGNDVPIRVAEDIASQDFVMPVTARKGKALKVVFVSRISPMKNILGAIEILKKVKKPLIYDIYGPIEDRGYWEDCQKKIRDLPVQVTVNYKGCLPPEEVVTTLAQYDAFFMPTKGENYSHVIAEALRASLPLVIADTTPWRDLQSQGLGWELSLSDYTLFSAVLDKLADMSAEEHFEMRKGIAVWAKQKFSQREAIAANIAMFHHAHDKNY